ncbi:MAG: hypothetical protein K2O45_15150 [Oscillospiraceae bacterium]|nr:hypothetical protein [Oscillospiraceae bacterium]
MENEKLIRMFDQVKLSREREEAMLADLLWEQEESRPMRNKRKLTVIFAAAAAMLLTVCALAVSEPTWRGSLTAARQENELPQTELTVDPALLRAFGAGPEDEHLLRGGVFTPDIHISSEKGSLTVRQAWTDRYRLAILWDFTAPEGTVLRGDNYRFQGRTLTGGLSAGWRIGNSDGQANHGSGSCWADFWIKLDDEDPEDNHLAVLQMLCVKGDSPIFIGGEYCFQFRELNQELFPGSETVVSGEWSGTFSLPEADIGENFLVDQTIALDGKNVRLETLYISPVTVALELGEGALELRKTDYRAASTDWREHIFLITEDGERIGMQKNLGSTGPDLCAVNESGRFSCQPERIIDPADIAAVELFGQSIPLASA